MTKILTDSKRESLIAQHKRELDKSIADRIKAALLTDDGWSIDELGKLYLSMIAHYVDIYVHTGKDNV